MQLLGEIIQLQIQTDHMKTGSGTDRVYRTKPLRQMNAIRITEKGIVGIADDGGEIIDVHHVDHRRSRNRGGANGISFSFTGHYESMRQRFGPHMQNGFAGENILIARNEMLTPDDFASEQIVIQSAKSGVQTRLIDVFDAAPCEPFARFAAGEKEHGAALKATLQFLDNGRRGFYATLPKHTPETLVRRGDKVYVVT